MGGKKKKRKNNNNKKKSKFKSTAGEPLWNKTPTKKTKIQGEGKIQDSFFCLSRSRQNSLTTPYFPISSPTPIITQGPKDGKEKSQKDPGASGLQEE